MLAQFAFAQTGNPFPSLSGETLDARQITLPDDTKGKFAFVALAASESAEEPLSTWYEPIYNHFIAKTGMFDDQFDVQVYFVPMFTGSQKVGRDKVMKNVRKNSESDELFPYVLFYEGEFEVFQKELKMKKKDRPYIFLLDPKGQVAYATSGYFEQSKMDAIDELMMD